MAKMYVMSGMSGSGKTYFSRKFAHENGLLYLNPDVFYAAFNGSDTVHEHEFEVWIALFQAIHAAEIDGKNILIDTNAPTMIDRVQFINWFPGFEPHLINIIAPYELCLQNNHSRERVIPQDQMERMWARQTLADIIMEPQWETVRYYMNENNHGFIALDRDEAIRYWCEIGKSII